MNELPLPWIELALLLPMLGALWLAREDSPERARRHGLVFFAATLFCTLAASVNFYLLRSWQVADPQSLYPVLRFLGRDFLVVDELSAPLLPLTALIFLLTASATLRIKQRRFSFGWTLLSEAIVLATLACKHPWAIIGLVAVATIPPFLELRARRRPTRVFAIHMLLFIGLLILGWSVVVVTEGRPVHSMWALVPLVLAVFIRSGIVPLHCWMTDLYEHATFGTALLFTVPLTSAYLAVRLVLPIAPDWVLHSLGILSLITAVYASGMALVQREARRFFCYLFISHSALVLAGLETMSPIGLTGALSIWLSTALSLAGFGLTLRALEARQGRLSLVSFHGLYDHTKLLATCFLLSGMASVGFPGTFGFVGTELVVDSAVQTYPHFGIAVVIAAAMNGIAVVKAFFLLFTGPRHVSSVPLRSRKRELAAVLALAILILGAGLYPQPGVASRHHAALEMLRERQVRQSSGAGSNHGTYRTTDSGSPVLRSGLR
jgi:NADH-quinone oxidoreductase subunit M